MRPAPLSSGQLGQLATARRGVVGVFDDDAGLGEVTDDAGASWPFHCTAVADGSRHVDEGAAVWFHLAAAPLGRLEARDIVPDASRP
ncbi:MAG TPA: hypothetical protein VMU75_14095 [Acidimicrobiales bacterium]|nr:hypothetical protein [Acidimicrobiales bacterium]